MVTRDEALVDLAGAIRSGVMTGHVPMACSTCGHIIMLQRGRKKRKCVLTLGCEGEYEPLP